LKLRTNYDRFNIDILTKKSQVNLMRIV